MANTGMLVSMKPTSISHSGTSASVNNNGGVDFTAVTSLSLNGVFTGDYDNYLVVLTGTASVGSNIYYQLRAAGVDASAGDYVGQYIDIAIGSYIGGRITAQTHARVGFFSTNTYNNGYNLHLYGPALAQPTASRGVSVSGNGGAAMIEWAWTHSLSTSYDGITIYPAANNMTGNVHVFGYRE